MIKKKIKGIIVKIFIFGLINQTLVPLVISGKRSAYSSSRAVKQQTIEEYKNLPKNFVAIDYLNLSNMLMHNKGEGAGVCRDYAVGTFDTYKKLIKNNNRADLESKIKLVTGRLEGKFYKTGHEWIKIKQENKWLDYESIDYSPLTKIKEIKEYSKSTLKNKQKLPVVLEGDPPAEVPLIEMLETLPGKKLFYPKPAAFMNGGAIEFFIRAFKGE